jgi:hypothetical protein
MAEIYAFFDHYKYLVISLINFFYIIFSILELDEYQTTAALNSEQTFFITELKNNNTLIWRKFIVQYVFIILISLFFLVI